MSVRKHGNGWQVRVSGFRAVTVPLKRDAQRLETDYKTRKVLGHLYQAEATFLGDELDGLLERKRTIGGKRGKLRPAGLAFYAQALKPWAPLREMLVPSLKRRHVEDHIMRRAAVAPVAARNELQVLKQALRDAQSRGQVVDEAIFAIDPVSHQAEEGRALTLAELERLAFALPERLLRLPLFVGSVGLRFSEATRLSDAMVDLDGARLLVPAALNKSRRPKPVPLAQYEVTLLREQMEAREPHDSKLLFPTVKGTPYSPSGFRSVWVPALKAAGLEGFRFHDLRHTAISLMAQAGMRPEMIALRVGHSDGGALILRRYRHLFASEVQAAVDLVDVLIAAASSSSSGQREDLPHVAPIGF